MCNNMFTWLSDYLPVLFYVNKGITSIDNNDCC
nr:hypothetical protein [Mucilaginibacter sp. SP1R1]